MNARAPARFRLLVLEDDDQDYRLLLRHLETHAIDFAADRARDASELSALLRGGRPDWNLVLADYSLPDIDIRTRLDWLTQQLPDAPVIIVSGSIGEEKAVDLMLAGVDDFVSKDNLARLVPAMDRSIRALMVRQARRLAEDQLQLRNRALEAAKNGIVVTLACDGMPMVYVNPASEGITGYPVSALLGRNCRLLHRDDDRQPGLETIRQGIAEGRACTAVLRNYRSDGALFWNKLSIAPVRNEAGDVTHFVGIQEDITENVLRERRLRQTATVFENAQEGMTITELDGSILEVNRAFTEITGYAHHEVVGRNPRMLRSGRHGPEFFQAMWASLEKTGRWSGEIWNRRKSGQIYPQLLTISTVRNEDGEPSNYVAVFADITRLKQSEEQLEYLAHHDPLTELPNRLLFNARLDHAIAHAQRQRQMLAVMFLDLDRFKNINDAHGHMTGDALLRQVGDRLLACVRLDDTVARIGGDEFVILLERITTTDDVRMLGEKILRAFSPPFVVDGNDHFASVSIGVAMFPGDAGDAATLLRNADSALYQAKEKGRNACHFYAPELTAKATERVALENDLFKAVENGELSLVYQPQVSLATGDLIGVEALLRWTHPVRGPLPPAVFVPIAEESGAILKIGRWVLETACRQARRWREQGFDFGTLAVNLSGPQIRDGGLHAVVREALDTNGLPGRLLELEVTESCVMAEVEQRIDDLRRLRDIGVGLSIDDFGTGYSSLAYLKRLPVNRLKIDRSFACNLPTDPEDAAIASAVIALGTTLGLDVVAEGIETDSQRRFLLGAGCPHGQGFLFSRPLPADDLAARFAGATTGS